MRTAVFNESGIFDDEAHAQVNNAADLMTPLLRRPGATIATGEAFKLRKTAFYLDRALKDRAVESEFYWENADITRQIEEGRLNTSVSLPEIKNAIALVRRDREMGSIGLGGLIIITSEYPVAALRYLQEEDEVYGSTERIEHGRVVLVRPGVL
jgi:hypothetical protein